MIEELQTLLIGAAESPPSRREEWLERVAAWGADAIGAVSDWLYDADLAPFAVRVMRRAAELGDHAAAVAALLGVDERQLDDTTRWSVRGALKALGVDESGTKPVSQPRRVLLALKRGDVLRRRELTAARAGGSQQSGISYSKTHPAVFLFSNPRSRGTHGYADGWEDESTYRYYGEWRGPGNMEMKWGNAAIWNKASDLLLFTAADKGMIRFEGVFEAIENATVQASNRGESALAIVFRLSRIAERYEFT